MPAVDDTDSSLTSSEAVTADVRVQVRSRYSPEHSDPAQSRWFFLYTITISNESDQAVKLVSRSWFILDATGKSEEIRGPGVLGEQPTLQPGQTFEYTSGCPLTTPFGSMAGSYEMHRVDGTQFEAEIRIFQLRHANAIH